MYFIGQDGLVHDDGYGGASAPAYAVDESGARRELLPRVAQALTDRFARDARGRFPIGDAVAAVTSAAGIAPCSPCQRRQEMLNRFGERIATFFYGSAR